MSYSRRNKKKVRCICHGPIAVSKKYSSPWEDVSIYWHEKRKPKCVWLTLNGMNYLKREYNWSKEKGIQQDVEEYLETIAYIEQNGSYFDDTEGYSDKDEINREEAENMIAIYLLKEKGNLKFEWDNPHGFVITPV